jgi:hypothetical protein
MTLNVEYIKRVDYLVKIKFNRVLFCHAHLASSKTRRARVAEQFSVIYFPLKLL